MNQNLLFLNSGYCPPPITNLIQTGPNSTTNNSHNQMTLDFSNETRILPSFYIYGNSEISSTYHLLIFEG